MTVGRVAPLSNARRLFTHVLRIYVREATSCISPPDF
jgi:hypothetical protein